MCPISAVVSGVVINSEVRFENMTFYQRIKYEMLISVQFSLNRRVSYF